MGTPPLSNLHRTRASAQKTGHGKRGTGTYDKAMIKAKNQAERYARALGGVEISGGRPTDDVDSDGDVTDFEPTVPSTNIIVDNVICDGNNRQGISVSSVIGLTVTNSQFINTQGALPESGVDFEPFRRYQPMQNVVFTD